MPRPGLARTLDSLLLAGAALCLTALAIHKLAAHDLWWQIRAGGWVLEHGWPDRDPFSFGFPEQPWIELRWLWCVGAHLVFELLGVNALILVKLALLLATSALLLSPAGGRLWPSLAGVVAALATTHSRFLVRPELVSFLLLIFTLQALERYRRGSGRRWLLALPVLQVLWVNAHTLFVLGPVVQVLYLVGELASSKLSPVAEPAASRARLRTQALVAGASILACLFNPWLLEGALFPLQLFGQIDSGHVLGSLIDEFQSPFAHADTGPFFLSYVAVAGLSLASFWPLRRRLVLGRLAVWCAFLYLSTLAQRNVALFGWVAGFVLAANLAERVRSEPEPAPSTRRLAWAVRAACGLFVVVVLPLVVSDAYWRRHDPARRFGFGVSPHRFPIRALAFVRQQGLPTPVLCGIGDGGYVLFEGGERSVFVDGRLEVYGPEILVEALRTLQTGLDLDQVARRHDVHTLLARNGQDGYLISVLERDPAWAPVYFDANHVVYLREAPATAAQLAQLRIDWSAPVERAVRPPAALAPVDWLAWTPRLGDAAEPRALGELFLNVGNFDLARARFERALEIDAGDPLSRLHLGLLLRGLGLEAEAVAWLRDLDPELVDGPDAQRLVGSVQERRGDPAAALESYRRALEHADSSARGYQDLARAALAVGEIETAVQGLERIVELQPGDTQAWNNLALALMGQGDAEGCLARLARSLELDPRQPAVLNQVGILEAQLGRPERARAALERALEVDPAYAPARENLRKLGGR